jgi:hypothetical protein
MDTKRATLAAGNESVMVNMNIAAATTKLIPPNILRRESPFLLKNFLSSLSSKNLDLIWFVQLL